VDRAPAPSLLPILRSQQQGEILALVLGDPDLELSLTEISSRTGTPHASVYREVERGTRAGLLTWLKIGNTRLVRANTASPYYQGLAEVLTRAFGPPAVLAELLNDISGIAAAYVYGSWAANHAGQPSKRPGRESFTTALTPASAAEAFSMAQAASSRIIGAASGSKYCAEWRVRRNRSKVGSPADPCLRGTEQFVHLATSDSCHHAT
jgi:hypothetical protein